MYIGIDPGFSGGVAVLYPTGLTLLHDMPLTEAGVITLLKIYAKSALIENPNKVFPCLEQIVPATFGKGQQKNAVSSVAKLYGSYMGLRMALASVGLLEHTVVPLPKQWQGYYGLKRHKGESDSRWKRRLMEKAKELYPRKPITPSTADALLLAHYCQHLHEKVR